ncbi:succinyl-CoA:acetate CoA-transferase [Saccharopolyspora erythraea NRRL 2338]|uniref:Acetyl-CoA hydrolase/transferase n=2 Tax=Saccharopolyspora erythraea TaxID=1836 RepID=A4FLX0_SACEN|nr:acetyl-CoA hydrolase/transferase family protein [Saccharopolyspora erythraea]EQD88259.1 acetyl-CoA hydrolase [Saccharopolyspora erythraea D]PFG98683.1 succinyl-CoA:acetate CoA-transferase [Saccharopolyspora erythraea NRRL 2338]QRK88701.1 acetyl-CoA hydrolase/transferase family protein [Saccharopolyspora erythraea]CAM05045.1 acetyl-CoA hydrolase/transferase [Saccharopolyspora erythraea NRRL 2338]
MRIRNRALADKVVEAEEAAAMIEPGANIGMSGFTGAGYPKEVPGALAKRLAAEAAAGQPAKVSLWTGASTAPELDGVLAAADGIDLRMPYQSDPVSREKINSGAMDYTDIHLSHVAQRVWQGFFGELDVAVVEVSGITEDGRLVPSSSVGNNKTWIECADKVILEVNSWQSEHLEGMHDIYYGTALPPRRRPIPLTHPADRIGTPYLECPPEKVVAVVRTDSPDRNTVFTPPDDVSRAIAGHVLDFLDLEVAAGRLPRSLLPLQSGVGNVANAVLAGLREGPFEGLTAYTEVIQDGMLELIDSGKLLTASATAFSLSPAAVDRFNRDAAAYRDRIVLRPQEISNHPELVRRLGCLAMNGVVEADIHGNINSTHLMGSRMQNGIGGSGDFARNAYVSVFVTPSVAKGGAISAIVPMVSHVDHTEHDVDVIVTEQGLADLRGLSPRRRAELVIDKCAHPDFRPALRDYHERALRSSFGGHTPHLLAEALSWHQRYLDEGTMRR